MNGSLTHHRAFELLPWYVNGTLEEDERADVRAHLGACLVCRRELGFLERLQEQVAAAPDLDFTPQRGLSALMRRIDAAEAPLLRRWWAGLVDGVRALRTAHPMLRSALLLQAAVILLAVVLLVRVPLPDRAPRFETLSDVPVAAAGAPGMTRLRVVFTPDFTVADVGTVLSAADAHIVDGPSTVGAFAIDVPSAAEPDLLARLQADPRVRFAAPAVTGAAQ